MEFRIVDKFEDFCALESDWEDLLGRIESPQVFYKFQWAKTYLEYYAPEWKELLCVVTGYENQKLIALFPFVLEKGVIRFITSKTADYNMVYVDNSFNRFSVLKKGIGHLLENRKIDRFYLNGFPGSSELYLLEEVFREMDLSAFVEEVAITPQVALAENSVNKFDKAEIRNIHRKERNLQKEHTIEIKHYDTLTEEILLFLAKHKLNKYDDSPLKYKKMRDFIFKLSKEIESNLFIGALFIDGTLAAAHLGFQDNYKVYSYISSYDSKYAKEGIGKLLNYMLLEEYVGRKEYDFLKGNERYKFDFCDEAGMIFNLLVFRKGTSYTIMQRAMNGLKNNHFVRKMMGR